MLQGAGELIRATGAAALAVYPAEEGNNLGAGAACAQGGYALGVAVTAASITNAEDYIVLEFNVNLRGAHGVAGAE